MDPNNDPLTHFIPQVVIESQIKDLFCRIGCFSGEFVLPPASPPKSASTSTNYDKYDRYHPSLVVEDTPDRLKVHDDCCLVVEDIPGRLNVHDVRSLVVKDTPDCLKVHDVPPPSKPPCQCEEVAQDTPNPEPNFITRDSSAKKLEFHLDDEPKSPLAGFRSWVAYANWYKSRCNFRFENRHLFKEDK